MSKLFSSIIFSFLLLFQTTAFSQEDIAEPTEKTIVEQEIQAPEVTEEQEVQPEVKEEVEPKEEISDAVREARAAEEAELREAGVGEESLAE